MYMVCVATQYSIERHINISGYGLGTRPRWPLNSLGTKTSMLAMQLPNHAVQHAWYVAHHSIDDREEILTVE